MLSIQDIEFIMTKSVIPKKIAILGVGLIGGSIALGLKRQLGSKITVFGLCSSLKRAQLAKAMNIVDKPLSSPREIPKNIDLIILAAPISINLDLLKRVAKLSLPNALIIDVGSTKKSICDLSAKLPVKSFLGTHPMAGKENTGIENTDIHLFESKSWIICPTEISSQSDIDKVSTIIKLLGAKPMLLDAQTHDSLTAWVSHLPLISSSILFKSIASNAKWSKIAEIASSGFRDTTRLASANPVMKRDILLTNKKNVIDSLVAFDKEIKHFINLLKKDKEQTMYEYFKFTKLKRDMWIEGNKPI